MNRVYFCLAVAAMILPSPAFCQDFVQVNSLNDVRLINEPSGLRNDNNGGNTISGALIGVNAGNVDNYIVHDFSNVFTTPELMGVTVAGATVTVEINEGFSADNEGSEADIIVLHEIALPNSGFIPGTGGITGADNPATNGSISFNNQAEFNSGSSVPWMDATGTPVADLLGALTELGTTPGINAPTDSPNPVSYTHLTLPTTPYV